MQARFPSPIICPVVIGRMQEVTHFGTLVDQARSGTGQVAMVCGEAGIGKSRLVAEVKTEAVARDFLLMQGTCFPTDHAIPYAPLLDLLRSHFSSHSSALAAPEVEQGVRGVRGAHVEQVAQAFLPLLPDVGYVLSGGAALPTLTPLDPAQEKRRRFETLIHFLAGEARVRPVLVVVEDLHWSDETSLEFLHYLARRCATHRFLLLLTYRSEEVSHSLRHFLAQLEQERLAQEILLARLTRDEVEAMLQAIFALPRSAHVELADLLYTLTEGNPFFVEEVLKSLLASGEIFYANERWQRKELRELHIPRSVQDAVQQRTDQLSKPARRVLLLAAVAGRRFDFALLQALTRHAEDDLLQLFKELMAAQLVVEESADQFAFRHALTQQAVYAELLGRERKALHLMLAETIERLYATTLEMHLADLANHFAEAGLFEKALEYAQRAGERAQRLYAPRAAIEQFTRALHAAECASIIPPINLYHLRGRAYATLGDFEQARLDYETTLRRAREAGDYRAEWQAWMDLGSLWAERDYSQTGNAYQQALALARHMDDPLTLAHSLNRAGNWHLNIEQPREALHYHQEALALFQQAQDIPGIAETFDLLGMTHYLGGDLLQASVSYLQAVALFQQLNDRQGLASSMATLMLLGEGGGYQTETLVPGTTSFTNALHYGELALQAARDTGQRSAEAYALFALAHYLGPRGEYARALELAQASLTLSGQIEHHQWLTAAHMQAGVLYFDLLALPEARQQFEQALAIAREIGSWNWIRKVSGLLAPVYLLQQNQTSAEAVLTAALEHDAPMQTIGQRLVWAARADLALARSDPNTALDITERLIASAANLSGTSIIPRLWKLRGESLAALGQVAEAETMLRAAEAAAQAQQLRPLLWRICVALGKLYQAQGALEKAEQILAITQATIETLAANVPDEGLRAHFLAQATTMLPQRRPLTPDRAARQAYGGLTVREREVAVLVSEGKTNREIADTLVVSHRTIETHVSTILSKLGFPSRSRIAVWAVEVGLVKNGA